MALRRLAAALLAASFLGGCASTPDGGPPALPDVLGALHSEINARLSLLATPDAPVACQDEACAWSGVLEHRVLATGQRLVEAVKRKYPDFADKKWEFVVADKTEPGTVSTSVGRIIVLRPVETLATDENVLAFILSREMAHVVARHHEDNALSTLIVSGLMQLLLPAAAISKLFAANAGTQTAATSAYASSAASVSVSTASFAGSQIVLKSYKPSQLARADQIGLELLEEAGYDVVQAALAFETIDLHSVQGEWMTDLRGSARKLAEHAARPRVAAVEPP